MIPVGGLFGGFIFGTFIRGSFLTFLTTELVPLTAGFAYEYVAVNIIVVIAVVTAIRLHRRLFLSIIQISFSLDSSVKQKEKRKVIAFSASTFK
jgi:hypothetical protein